MRLDSLYYLYAYPSVFVDHSYVKLLIRFYQFLQEDRAPYYKNKASFEKSHLVLQGRKCQKITFSNFSNLSKVFKMLSMILKDREELFDSGGKSFD